MAVVDSLLVDSLLVALSTRAAAGTRAAAAGTRAAAAGTRAAAGGARAAAGGNETVRATCAVQNMPQLAQ